jgi:chorismate lyase / 3-hydroxybenzoate synthase
LQAKHLGSQPSDTAMRSIPGEQPAAPGPATLRVAYQPLPLTGTNAPVLAAIRFGGKTTTALGDAALTIDVGLEPLQAPPTAELWFASGPVHTGQWSDAQSGGRGVQIRFAHDEHHLFAVLELDEREHGGILLTAERAYAAIQAFQERSAFRHLLRMWNYMDAINEGVGDMERYRQFCVGRGRGLGAAATQGYPSASALGRHLPDNLLQVFWLAGKVPGRAIENPRQVSAYHYPRVHGPVSPTFARALVAPDETVLISGTASIVGHVSQHHDNPMEQLEETVRNLAALMPHVGRARASSTSDTFKIYVRDPALTAQIAERLRQLYPNGDFLFVAADVCRRELLVEIEAVLAT